jgi:hypothetical protein
MGDRETARILHRVWREVQRAKVEDEEEDEDRDESPDLWPAAFWPEDEEIAGTAAVALLLPSPGLDDAGPNRHPEWRTYPRGLYDFERLQRTKGIGPHRAEVIMSCYGSAWAFLMDTPAGVEERTGGAIISGLAERLLRRLKEG